MKISNETKVGALTAIAITVLILGFNFLKGKGISAARYDKLYTIFPNVEGLMVSNPVIINGLQVGKVTDIREKDKNLSGIVVTINLSKNINIPRNSVAMLNSELLGITSVKINLGAGTEFVDNGDTLQTERTLGLSDKLQQSIDPAITNVNKSLTSLDELLQKLNMVFDPNTRNNLQEIIADAAVTSKHLEQLLNTQTGILAKTLNGMEKVTQTMARNTGKIDTTISNLEKATGQLADADFEGTIESLKKTLAKLETTLGKLDGKDGTLGLLLNDRQLYDEIRQTNRSLNILLDDFRVNPKRYVNISVFGKKDKKGPLLTPLSDSAK